MGQLTGVASRVFAGGVCAVVLCALPTAASSAQTGATNLNSSANPAVAGEPVTYTATVSPAPDGGTVAFDDNGQAIPGCSAVAVHPSNGRAVCQLTFKVAGWYAITASYSGDASFAASSSPQLTQAVYGLPTRTALSSSAPRSVTGAGVLYRALVAPAPDGGSVAFLDRGRPIPGCAAVPVRGGAGEASCRTSFPLPGSYQIESEYSGDGSFAPSRSGPLTEWVRPSLQVLGIPSAGPTGETLKLRCAPRSGGCRARETLTTNEWRGRGARRRRTTIVIGASSARVPAGRTRTVAIDLAPDGRALLASFGKLAVTLDVASIVDGTPSVILTRRQLVEVEQPPVTGAEVVAYAEQFIGVPYEYGGNGPGSFDCSGFTVWVYAHFGYSLPRTSWEQMDVGEPVAGPLQLGDLVFWDNGGHVGIYTGNDTFISATLSRGIWIYSFAVWSQTQSFTTARRILGGPKTVWRSSPAFAFLPRNGGPRDATP